MIARTLPGIILAAGNSSRMGQNKLLLPFRGKPILQHVVDAAHHSTLAPLILVLGPDDDTIRQQIQPQSALVVNTLKNSTDYGSSLQTGLRILESQEQYQGAMFIPGDQPLLRTHSINMLVQAFQQDPSRWVAPSCQGQRGNPVITPSSCFDKIYAIKGDHGPRKHLKDPASRLKLVELEDEGVLFDIDSPEDYQRLLRVE